MMDGLNQCLIARDRGVLQMPYADYVALMERAREAERVREVRASVVAALGGLSARASAPKPVAVPEPPAETQPPAAAPKPAAAPRAHSEAEGRAPIKKDIADHFNRVDESGRLFGVFQQYYACLNDACGGTVRVTMRDGFCSLLNYDEWEEFAFVDLFEGHLRVAVHPRYTDELNALDFCEVPRLLSSRRNVVCVQVDDLNNTMLEVLERAFEEVGLNAR